MNKRLFIFRHGETDWNVEGRFQGHLDIPLNDVGRSQAQALGMRLKQHKLEAILTSDLSRSKETAEIVGRICGIPVFEDARLREAHLGQAQGKTYEEISLHFGEELLKRWRSHNLSDADVSYPGGETGIEVINRTFLALSEFMEKDFSRVGIATHGGVIRRLFQKLQPPGSAPVPIPNTILYQFSYDTQSREWGLSSF